VALKLLKLFPFRAFQLKILADLLRLNVCSVAEIGVYRGANAKCLRTLFPEAQLYLIDPWMLSPEYVRGGGCITQDPTEMSKAFETVMECFGNDPLTKVIRKTSEDAIHDVNCVDIAFIDGDHSYKSVIRDIELWQGKVREGGILAGHDYGYPGLDGVKQAVDECFGNDVIIGSDYTWLKVIRPS